MRNHTKTIRVRIILDKINHALASETLSRERKLGLAGLLETILMDTGNYAGFGYLSDYQTDEASRFYYVHPNLREEA